MNRFTFVGKRTSTTYKTVEFEPFDYKVNAEIRLGHGNEPWLYLLNGPVPASMPIANLREAINSGGWLACYGGDSHDRLMIPGSELQKVVEELS